MIRSKSLIFSENSSRVGKAISESWWIGVPSCFSGGRRMVKWTRSTAASDLSRLRHVRSPACGSPETRRTRRFSRTPSAAMTTRLLAGVSSPGTGSRSISRMFWPECGNGMRMAMRRSISVRRVSSACPSRRIAQRHAFARAAATAGLAHGHLDLARLADDAELGRLQDLDAAVELVGLPGQQRMHGRVEAETGGALGHVVHLPVGDHDHAGETVGRHVGERAIEVGEEIGARRRLRRWAWMRRPTSPRGPECAQSLPSRSARIAAVCCGRAADGLAGALVGDDDGDVGEALALLLPQRRIGERRRAAPPAPRRAGPRRACAARAGPPPAKRPQPPLAQNRGPGSIGEMSMDQLIRVPSIARAARAARARAPDRPCSCRSART